MKAVLDLLDAGYDEIGDETMSNLHTALALLAAAGIFAFAFILNPRMRPTKSWSLLVRLLADAITHFAPRYNAGLPILLCHNHAAFNRWSADDSTGNVFVSGASHLGEGTLQILADADTCIDIFVNDVDDTVQWAVQ